MTNIRDTRQSGGKEVFLGGALTLPNSDFVLSSPPLPGSIRYDTGIQDVEVFNGATWGTIGSTGTLADSGVTPGIYTKVTVDVKGRITFGDFTAVSDLSDVLLTSIADNQILAWNAGSSKWLNISPPYDAYGTFIGKPADSQILWRIVFARTVTFPINLTDSVAVCLQEPLGDVHLPILQNGVQIGSIDFPASVTIGSFTFSAPVTFVSGDIMEVDGPSPIDATLFAPSWSFIGSRG